MAEEDGVAEGPELEGVEVVCGVDVCLTLRITRDAEVVVEFQRDLAGAVQLFFVEVGDLGVGLENVVDRLAVLGVQ